MISAIANTLAFWQVPGTGVFGEINIFFCGDKDWIVMPTIGWMSPPLEWSVGGEREETMALKDNRKRAAYLESRAP